MRYRRVIFLGATAIVLAALVIRWWAQDDPDHVAKKASKQPAFSVGFLGYSNGVSGTKWALLEITNRDSCCLHFAGPPMLVWSNSLGETSEVTRVSIGADTLHSRSSCTMAVEVSMASGAWRFWCRVNRLPPLEAVRYQLPEPVSRWLLGAKSESRMLDTGWRLQ
jgi:hypothetical protein